MIASLGAAAGQGIDASKLGARIVALETEFAFVLKSDLPPRGSPYSEPEARNLSPEWPHACACASSPDRLLTLTSPLLLLVADWGRCGRRWTASPPPRRWPPPASAAP